MFAVSFLPILISGFVAVFIGWAWYHPRIFGTAWARMSNLSPEEVQAGRRQMPFMAFFGFLAALVAAYVMSYFAIAWEVIDFTGALELAFWIWLGFTAVPMLGTVLWEQKPFKLYLINALYWYVTFSVMSVIIVFGMGISAGASAAAYQQSQTQYVAD